MWRLDHVGEIVELRDDGFGIDAWTRITMAINAGLAPHGVEAEKSALSKLFDS